MRKLMLLIIFFTTLFSTRLTYGKHSPTELKKHVFKIDGKITYKNGEGSIRGLYGATVVLHMLKKGDGMIAPLTGSSFDPKDLKVSLQPDGSFSFDLQMLSNLIMFDRIFLEVYPGDTHGSINYDSLQYITTSSIGKVAVWNQQVGGLPFRGIELPFDNNQMNHEFHNMQIEVMPNFGGACRYLKIANEFGKWFYKKIGKDISIPSITVGVVKEFKHKNGTGDAGGYFNGILGAPPLIEIKFSEIISESTTAHEYGHYLHYLLNKGNFSLLQYPLVLTNTEAKQYYESIADFFRMAIRKYAEVIHTDKSVRGNNFEKIPFDIPSFENCNYCDKYYASPRWTSYLWNIFDGPSQTFDKPGYIAYDNDDVDGEKEGWYKEIFNIISSTTIRLGFKIKTYLHDPVKSRKGKEKLAVSLEHMYKFLLQRIGHKMLPVQVKKASLEILDNEDHMLYINYNHYPGKVNYKNPPTGFRVYGKKDNTWVIIKEFPYKSEYDDREGQLEFISNKEATLYKNFRIAAYNEVGESLHPYEFVNSSLPITIEGPTNIIAGTLNQWKAKVTGGVLPMKYYSWAMKKIDEKDYFEKDQYGSASSFTTTAPENQSFILEVWAQDANSAYGYARLKVNTTILPLKASITGTSLVMANQTNYWQSEVTGGIPPYSYSWVKQIDGQPALHFISQTKSCSTKTDQSFTLKLQVKDSRGTTVVVTKPIELNTQAAAISIIDGAKLVYLHQPNNQWKTEIIGGIPPYEISWYRKYDNELNYSWVATGNTYQKGYIEKEGVFYLKTTVKDATGVIRESAPYKVTALYQPLYVAILNENVLLKTTDKITWQADITGGKPFYYCTWKVGKDVNNLTTIKEGHIGYELHPSCEYQPKFNDAGKYTIVLTVKDTEGKEITIYKDFMVQGMDIRNQQITQSDGSIQPLINFSIYPNPAPGFFTLNYTIVEDADITMSLISTNDNREIRIYQQHHKKGVYNKNFNTSLFPIGNYILKVTQKDTKGRISIHTEKILLLK